MNLDLWFGPGKRNCGPCSGSGVGYGCPCFKCDGRGWKYKEKPEEAWYQTRQRWRRKVDNYLMSEIADAFDEVCEVASDQPHGLPIKMQAGADQDWSEKLGEAIEKHRRLVERRSGYVATRESIRLVCDRCKDGEERSEQGHPVFSDIEDTAAAPDQDETPTQIGSVKCPAAALWDELKQIEKGERDDVD